MDKNNQFRKDPIGILNGHKSTVTDISVTEDGDYLVSSSIDSTLILWETCEPFKCVAVYRAPSTERNGFNCVSAGKELIISGSENGVVRIWPVFSPKFKSFFHQVENKL